MTVSNLGILARLYRVQAPAMRSAHNTHRTETTMPKYLFLQRSQPRQPQQQQQPSPAQMQEMYAAFNAWKEKFKANILDMGGKLMPGGKVVTTAGASDGPFVETKEIVGGYMLVVAESLDHAIEVARECPGVVMPGSSVEIREIAGA
jgi:hypothetical protein